MAVDPPSAVVRALCLAVVAGCVGPESGAADDPPQEPRPVPAPPAPGDGDLDWVRLDSGEWFHGRVERLRDGALEFDSEGLDAVELDWSDVVDLRSGREWTLQTVDGEVARGRLEVDAGVVAVESPDGERRTFARRSVLAVVRGRRSELDRWSGGAMLGFTGRSGNTSQADYTVTASLARETVSSRWSSNFRSALSDVQGVRTAENQRFQSRYEVLISDRLFIVPVAVDVYRDPFQNVALRVTPYAGLGYDVIDAGGVDWSVTGGPAFLYERSESVGPGEDEADGAPAAIFTSRFGWDLTDHVEFALDYDITASFPGDATFNHHLVTGLSLDLIADFDLDVQLVWDRVNDPAADTSGQRPEQDDYRLTVGLGWDF